MTSRRSVVGVVIPAHDEAAVIGANLRLLTAGVEPGRLDVVVVCNGCHDDTAAAARSVAGVRVLEIPEASKSAAVAIGNQATSVFPRVHLDADCAISGQDVLRLAAALGTGVLAASPARRLELGRSSWFVRSYYRVWEQLPQVRAGIFGRGVFALSAAGQARVDALPQVMSDDLAVSDAFGDDERRIVPEAVVTVRAPRTARDLIRRRVRAATGNRQAGELGVRRPGSATSMRTLARMAVRDPRLAPRIPVFLGTGLLARWMSRRAVRAGDYTTWLRDESSRTA